MKLKTKRWNDPAEPDDGLRLLVCRYRPRGVRKEAETWNAWSPELAPSRELLARHYGKAGPPVAWPEFRTQYRAEMREQGDAIAAVAARVAAGEAVTLLCSSACTDPDRCHRVLLAELVAARARGLESK
jgi:uncharacterized protein YeaO (DUF488 family)